MLIDEDDISNDVITFGTRFSIMFVYIRARFRLELTGRNLTAQSKKWNSNSRDVVASSPSFSRLAAKAPRRTYSQAFKAHDFFVSFHGSFQARSFMMISLLVWFSLTLHPARHSLKACRAKWYVSRVQHLPGEKQSKWWQAPWRGMKSKSGDLVYQIQVEGFSDLSQLDQANAINAAFLERLEEYQLPFPFPASPWRNHPLPNFLFAHTPDIQQLTESRVERILAELNLSKASGPDQIRN